MEQRNPKLIPVDTLVGMLLDSSVPLMERMKAAHEMASSDAPCALSALLQVVESSDDSPELAWEAGRSLGLIFHRQGRVLDAPLEDFTGSAYLGFDTTVAELQRAERGLGNSGE